jgi:hypothetical protein
MDLLSCYAIATNEVNAAGGRVVTGACRPFALGQTYWIATYSADQWRRRRHPRRAEIRRRVRPLHSLYYDRTAGEWRSDSSVMTPSGTC